MRSRIAFPLALLVPVVIGTLLLTGCGEQQSASGTGTSGKAPSPEKSKKMQAQAASQEAAMRASDAQSRKSGP